MSKIPYFGSHKLLNTEEKGWYDFFNQEIIVAAQRIKFALYQEVCGIIEAGSMGFSGILKYILYIFFKTMFGLLWDSIGSKECWCRISEKIWAQKQHFSNLRPILAIFGWVLKVAFSRSKNNFYLLQWQPFILEVLFVLKIFKFVSWFFDHVEKTAWLER